MAFNWARQEEPDLDAHIESHPLSPCFLGEANSPLVVLEAIPNTNCIPWMNTSGGKK